MYGAAKNVIVTSIFNPKKANVLIRKFEKDSKTKRVKIIYTLKPKHFGKDSDISEESFKILLSIVADKYHAEFVAENFGVESAHG